MTTKRYSLRRACPLICAFACLGSGLVLQPGQALAQRPAVRPVYDQWTTYLNPRLRWQVPVPPGLRAQSDPKRGSSCRFVSDDGSFSLKTWGSTLALPPGDPLEDVWREALNLRGRRIDFQRRSTSGFVVAGVTSDGLEFFEKVILGNGAVAGMNAAYPPSLAARYAPWIDEIEQGFGWHPAAAALSRDGAPTRGIFPGIRQYFTGGDELPPYRPEGDVRDRQDSPAPDPDSDKTKVDLTPPPPAQPRENPASLPLEKPPISPALKPAPVKREDLPYGIAIPGKKGYVFSPYTDNKQQVDVTDIPTGTKVKCPYTGKVFRVP